MHTTNLRKVGGSVMLTVPPALLDILKLGAGETVGLSIEGTRLVIEPQPKPQYHLDDLLAQCDTHQEGDQEEQVWLETEAVGNELL